MFMFTIHKRQIKHETICLSVFSNILRAEHIRLDIRAKRFRRPARFARFRGLHSSLVPLVPAPNLRGTTCNEVGMK